MDCIVHGVAKSWTRLSDFTFFLSIDQYESIAIRNRRWAVGEGTKLHLYLQQLHIAHITASALPPVRSVASLDFHRSKNPTVNCSGKVACSYENLIPDALDLHYGELHNYFIIYHNVIITDIICTINMMCLNHPQTIPHSRSVEKLPSMKLVPGTEKIGDCYSKDYPFLENQKHWQTWGSQQRRISLQLYTAGERNLKERNRMILGSVSWNTWIYRSNKIISGK